jgi:hypothetical protein
LLPFLHCITESDLTSQQPLYQPQFTCQTSTWIFSSQYFFEIGKNGTVEPHAATGEVFPAKVGEKLFTTFKMDTKGVWTLQIGVVGDAARVSTVVVEQPYMGLLHEETTSFLEPTYSETGLNSCWELYIHQADQYPSSGSNMSMQTFRSSSSSNSSTFDWEKNWTSGGDPSCPGKPTASTSETDNATHQAVEWDVYFE